MPTRNPEVALFRKTKAAGIPLAQALDSRAESYLSTAKAEKWRASELAATLVDVEEAAGTVYGAKPLAAYRADRNAKREAIAEITKPAPRELPDDLLGAVESVVRLRDDRRVEAIRGLEKIAENARRYGADDSAMNDVAFDVEGVIDHFRKRFGIGR